MKTIFVLFISLPAFAEYRAYELVITNSVTGQEKVVLSSLDPDQYRGYHPLSPNEAIAYRDTWMCRGNTSEKAICPKPEKGRDSKKKKT
jgi:hypothetical protein